MNLRATSPGLRVLPTGNGPFGQRPREVLLLPDDAQAARLVTVYGGKLTTYRATATRVLRLLARALQMAGARADTAALPLAD